MTLSDNIKTKINSPDIEHALFLFTKLLGKKVMICFNFSPALLVLTVLK